MRRKTFSRFYIFVFVFLFLWSSFSKNTSEQIRNVSIASIAPAWSGLAKFNRLLCAKPVNQCLHDFRQSREKIAQLELENTLLKNEIEKISKILVSEERILSQLESIKKIENQKTIDANAKAKLEKKLMHMISQVRAELMAMPAQVVYRDPSSWSCSLWINLGEDDNEVLGSTVIAKNSPVVLGSSLVGVIDFVGKKQSKVRLITDSSLIPSVRVARGVYGSIALQSSLKNLLIQIESIPNKESLLEPLKKIQSEVSFLEDLTLLAKGQIHGSGSAFWRSRCPKLKGVGFNFDFQDADASSNKSGQILKKGDLLLTSGLDGVFPSGLKVGVVEEVYPPKSGGFVYNADVRPLIDPNDLDMLFVLPPRSD